jgi:hypothetical protein
LGQHLARLKEIRVREITGHCFNWNISGSESMFFYALILDDLMSVPKE